MYILKRKEKKTCFFDSQFLLSQQFTSVKSYIKVNERIKMFIKTELIYENVAKNVVTFYVTC